VRLRGVLSGAPDAEPPDEWVISRICEEFGCLPSQARRELECHDAALVFTILELRTYARAKEAFDRGKKEKDGLTDMPPRLLAWVVEIEEEALTREFST
jgi:hypothetical protein